MNERKTFTFSIDHPKCQSCKHYDDCKNKRLALCNYLEPAASTAVSSLTDETCERLTVPHEYRDIQIGKNITVTIDLMELKKQMEKDFYKSCGLSGDLI